MNWHDYLIELNLNNVIFTHNYRSIEMNKHPISFSERLHGTQQYTEAAAAPSNRGNWVLVYKNDCRELSRVPSGLECSNGESELNLYINHRINHNNLLLQNLKLNDQFDHLHPHFYKYFKF